MTTSPGNDHRVETRLDMQETIFIEAMHNDANEKENNNNNNNNVILCTTLDLSANGLQVAMDQLLEIGSILRLCIDLPDKDPMFLVAEVKWIRSDDAVGGYRTGFLLFDSADSNITQWKLWIADLLSQS